MQRRKIEHQVYYINKENSYRERRKEIFIWLKKIVRIDLFIVSVREDIRINISIIYIFNVI